MNNVFHPFQPLDFSDQSSNMSNSNEQIVYPTKIHRSCSDTGIKNRSSFSSTNFKPSGTQQMECAFEPIDYKTPINNYDESQQSDDAGDLDPLPFHITPRRTSNNHIPPPPYPSNETMAVGMMFQEKSADTALLPFPLKLHTVLTDAQNNDFEHIISWQSEDSFKVHDVDAFCKMIVPRYFQSQSKYKSFLRQLNLYEFERVTKGPFKGGYQHPHFKRSCTTTILSKMKILKIKGHAKRNSNTNRDVKQPSTIRLSNSATFACSSSATANAKQAANEAESDGIKFHEKNQEGCTLQPTEAEDIRPRRRKIPLQSTSFGGRRFFTI